MSHRPRTRVIEEGSGTHGRWLRLAVDSDRQHPEWDACVVSYLINIPNATPLGPDGWDWYVLQAIHLRNIPGTPPPVKLDPHHTHEVMAFAFDPKTVKDVPVLGKSKFLQPANLSAQFACESDLIAAAVVSTCIEELVNGRLSLEYGWFVGIDANNPSTAVMGIAGGKTTSAIWREIIINTLEHPNHSHPGDEDAD